MTLQTDINTAAAQVLADSIKLKDIVNGNASTVVTVDSGPVKSVAKAIAEIGDTTNQALKDLSNVTVADFLAKAVAAGTDGAGDILAANNLSEVDPALARANLGAEAADPDILKAYTSDTLSVGMLAGSHDLGILTAATTLQIANGNLQHATLGGSLTLTAPNDVDGGYLELELTVDATGGYTLTLLGFLVISGTFDNTANAINLLRVSKLNTNTYLEITQGY